MRSAVARGAAGEPVEVATIGNERMAGLGVFLGVTSSATLQMLTHEFLAQMLGTRRATVTEIAGALREANAVSKARFEWLSRSGGENAPD